MIKSITDYGFFYSLTYNFENGIVDEEYVEEMVKGYLSAFNMEGEIKIVQNDNKDDSNYMVVYLDYKDDVLDRVFELFKFISKKIYVGREIKIKEDEEEWI